MDCAYQHGTRLLEQKDYDGAIAVYESISGYRDSADKIALAKKERMLETYQNEIQLMTSGVWFYNGGSDGAVNRLTFTRDSANVTQIFSDGNGTHVSGSNELPFAVDDTSIVLTLVDGREQTIAYHVEDGALVLEGGYLTPEEVERDLQGYWDLRESDTIIGVATENEFMYFFDNGKVVYESAAKAYQGRNGEYYYYGPYEGTYTVSENGLEVDAKNNWQFGFNVIDGKAVMVRCGDVCTPATGFKGENGYQF